MENFTEHINKELTNFSQFAEQFSKILIPIVDTAIKMSTEEPVSAFSVFKAAKTLAGDKKKSKKQNGTTKEKNGNKGSSKPLSCPRILGGKKAAGKPKVSNSNDVGKAAAIKNKPRTSKRKNLNNNNKKSQLKQKAMAKNSKAANFKDSEITDLVEHLYTDDSKKLTKVEQKKKKDLEDYLIKELEKDDAQDEDDEESYDSEYSDEEEEEEEEEEDSYSDYETYSDETDSFTDDRTGDEETSSTNEDDNQAAEALAQEIVSRANKKRKSPDTNLPKTKSNSTDLNSAAKKTKKSDGSKITSRKSLPPADTEKVVEPGRKRSSFSGIDHSINKSTTKSAATKSSITTTNVKLEPFVPPSNIVKLDSIEEGKRALKWLLNPVTVDDFFAKYWEKRACLIKRQQSNYFEHLISFEAIDQMLLTNHIEFTKNIDITSYKNGIRETLNPEGRALPPIVWDHYGQGCSIRLLNPQTFLPALFTLSTTMQEFFHCLVGANAYLTPSNSQGFAPHYDDIEAFVLQIEGRKRWKLYKARNTSEILPRYSSQNFNQQEIGKPVLEEVLEPGDVLYFPRGTIHQANTEGDSHSLHITLSVYQKQSFADLFEKMLPLMLQKAIHFNVDLRRGLPLQSWRHAGIAFSSNLTKERADFTKTITQLMHKCLRDMPLHDIIDAGMDQLAKKFQHEALPPEILPAEKLRTVFGSRSRTNERGECVCDYDIDERTNVRLLRANILRLVKEDDKLRIYYYLDNSKEYCEYEPNFIEIQAMEAASVEILIKSYPQYVGVSQLPLDSDERKITLVTALWERGLLMMEKPFR